MGGKPSTYVGPAYLRVSLLGPPIAALAAVPAMVFYHGGGVCVSTVEQT